MARVPPASEPLAPAARAELERQLASHGRLTHLKRTLAHSPAALDALMRWYPLRDEVAGFLGERPTTLFVHAVSTGTECLICSTFFRRILIEAGDDPDHLRLDDHEAALVAYGAAMARDPRRVPDPVYRGVAAFLEPPRMVALTALGGMMIATNVVVNALELDLDEYLLPYRRPGPAK